MKMMLKTVLVAGGLVLAATLPARATLIAGWDFTGENQLATSTADVSVDPNLAGAPVLTRGSGAAASVGANSFRAAGATGFQNNGISTANTDYFQTTLAAASGYTLSLSTIDARFAGTATFANSPGVSSQFAYSLDGVTFILIGSPSVTIGTPTTMSQIDLSGISALQNVNASTTVSFRYYASGQTTTGGWGFNSPSAGQDGLDFGGTLTAVPEASTWYTGIGMSLAMLGTFVRRIRK